VPEAQEGAQRFPIGHYPSP